MSGLHLALDVDCRYCYIILQTAVLPHTSNLRSLVKKASVIKRKMSTKSKISVKMSDDGCVDTIEIQAKYSGQHLNCPS